MEQVLYKLPEGWDYTDLASLCKFENGDRGKNYPSRDAFVASGIPVINAGNLDGRKIIEAGLNYIPRERYDILGSGKVRQGDLLFCLRGSLGKCAIVSNLSEGAIASSLVIVRPSEALDPNYLLYYFNSPLCSTFIERYNNGAAQPNLSAKSLSKFLIPLTSQKEQKRIVEKLDALLTRIDIAIEHLQESVTLKNSLLQSALDGQFSAITDRMTIESLAEVKGGKRLPKGEKLSDEETEHPYIRVADFTDKGTIDLSGIKYVSKEIHEQIKRYVISKDDLYISIAGTIGKTGFVPPELDGANLTENAAKLVIRDKQQLDLSYLYLFTLTSDFSAQAGLATKTVAQPKLALTRLSKIEIPMCSLEEQKSLVSTIEALKSKIHDAEAVLLGKIEDLKSLKASILDSAFKGEL
ncbi:restriction endonuclease subunit S [Vibrio cholerae]|jgi:type I restriction enzyme S subunit|uniref:restriction endonuclease subunit S n=1 Tax=Oceanimonas sp. CAM02 TaxID=3080336 RepID=UPI001EC4518D|nr:restriction endonuclease subunit S [Oceanimonas sp. CAM02]EGR0546369.1 restriction endonuclease subunit S [Vibrio cholerae]EGR0574273.1 restriction endonuclease subunit S [Vibrio cholerae]EGR5460084.1 restriction endonuclease subunit S [Vibrio cholerae]MDV2858237.1 restriction endonuclease subunit S [Oceanimonas sp. CAM02]